METVERWSPLLYRDFLLACISRFGFGLGTQMQTVAIAWHVYDRTGDPFALGFLGLAGFLPAVSLVLFTGYVADTVERRLVLSVSIGAMAVSSFMLLLFIWSGSSAIWPIYIFVLIYASARAFYSPASQAIVPNLVPRHHFGNAIAFGSSVQQVATISGPAIGGLLYAVHPTAPFIACAACFTAASVAMALIRFRSKPNPTGAADWSNMLAGLRYTWKQRVVLGAISLDMFAVVLGGAVALMPIFAKDILQVGPWGLGFLRSAPAVGALITATYISSRPPISRNAGKILLLAVAAYGAATIGFGLSESFVLSLLFLAAVGAADCVSVCIRMTMVQAETPDELRGRVASVNSLFITTSNEIGQFEAGVLAGFFGAVTAAVIGGVGAIMVAAIWAHIFPELRDRQAVVPELSEKKT
ncbi:MAG: hypothetical protein RLZ98_1898 [Pseudomonadota bacterium]|jgi:MFS family permease